jgi:hypothetical protein
MKKMVGTIEKKLLQIIIIFSGLLNKLNCSEEEFIQYISEFKEYRDTFVAHLDDRTTG